MNDENKENALSDHCLALCRKDATAAAAHSLVRCLAQLDGVTEAKAFMRYHTRTEVREEV